MLLSKDPKKWYEVFFNEREHEQAAKRILNSIGPQSWTSEVGKKWSQEFKVIYFSPACWEILECLF